MVRAECLGEDRAPWPPHVFGQVEQAGSTTDRLEEARQQLRFMYRNGRVGVYLCSNVRGHGHKVKAAHRPQVEIEDSSLGEMLTSYIAESALIVRIARQLVQHGLHVKQVPEEEIVTRGNRLQNISGTSLSIIYRCSPIPFSAFHISSFVRGRAE